ncbi:MAG: MMPL family transporter, partial [Clostridiales bacterium]|nr:MMPL family transporter [Clostridiales bacterium]
YEADNPEYNKDGHTLFIVSTYYAYGSDEEKAVEAAIKDTFSRYEATVINDGSGGVEIPIWIVCVALVILTVIMLIMCNSWIEPFLFFAAIGCAVAINMGSNVFLDGISSTTSSIAAILQLVLSMDYSIMLMNRYRQELKLTESKTEAMRNALKNVFFSIGGSATTTIIGLLMLLFMSFKIGADLGVVLAKGVAISLLCTFTVLPGLILPFDKVIKRTAKKSLNVRAGGLARLGFGGRRILACVFGVLFAGSLFLQSFAQTTYSLKAEDAIADVFPKSNTIVLLYENIDSEDVAKIAELLGDDQRVKSASSYSSTIGKPYTAAELAGVVSAMGLDAPIDPAIIDIIFYAYYSKGQTVRLTVGEFLRFIADNSDNPLFLDQTGDGLKENIDRIAKFSDAAALTRPMTSAELSDFLEMDPDNIKNLFLYYYMLNGGASTVTMTLSQFADFVVDEVSTNSDYREMFDADALAMLSNLAFFTNAEEMTASVSYQELSAALAIEPEQAKMLFVYYFALSDGYTPESMTVPAFVDFLIETADNPMFAGQFDQTVLEQMQTLRAYTNPTLIRQQMTSTEMASFFGQNAMETGVIYMMYMMQSGSTANTMSPEEYVDYILLEIAPYLSGLEVVSEEQLEQLKIIQPIMKASVSGEALSYSQTAQMLGMDRDMAKMLYTLDDSSEKIDSWTLSVQTVINFIADNAGAFEAMLDGGLLSELETARRLVNGSVAGTSYKSDELSALVGMDGKQVEQLYLLYHSEHGDTSDWKISIETFMDFLIDDVLQNDEFAGLFDSASLDELTMAKTIIDSVISDRTYAAVELAAVMSGLSDGINANTLDLLYLYYASINNADANRTLSIQSLFDYLTEDIVGDPRFEKVIDEKFRGDIADIKTMLAAAASQLKGKNYSRLIIETTLPDESEETNAFLDNLTDLCEERLVGNYYLIGNSPMSYEMSKSFGNEMLFITILTALAIFIIVAIIFRSLTIPAILVLIVQCGVFITVAASGLIGYDMYYLSSLIVQCILMGATIDYGILFTSYYRENRKTMGAKEALGAAYNGSIHTILTSASIMVLVLGVIGMLPCDPAIGTICQTLSIGALFATLLILFVLPGLLVTFDRFVVKAGQPKKL